MWRVLCFREERKISKTLGVGFEEEVHQTPHFRRCLHVPSGDGYHEESAKNVAGHIGFHTGNKQGKRMQHLRE